MVVYDLELEDSLGRVVVHLLKFLSLVLLRLQVWFGSLQRLSILHNLANLGEVQWLARKSRVLTWLAGRVWR